MSRDHAIAILLVVLSTIGVVLTRSIWPAVLLVVLPLGAIAVLTAAVWVARKLRI